MLIEQYNSQFSERSKINTIKDDKINSIKEGYMSSFIVFILLLSLNWELYCSISILHI